VARLAAEAHAGVEVVEEVATGEEAVAACLRVHPDILVLDLDLPDIDGFEVTRRLRSAGSTARILATTGTEGPDHAFRTLRHGIAGCIEKLAVDRLPQAIERLAAGGNAFTPEQERLALAQFGEFLRRARETARVSSVLSTREREILSLAAEGLTTRQTASRLCLSERTVESHLRTAYRKLGVRTRYQAIAKAGALGIVGLGPLGRARAESHPTAAAAK
jgi:DNA-binding NarL/FixJ family response regulator